MTPSCTLETHGDATATLWFDCVGKSVNAFDEATMSALDDCITDIQRQSNLTVVWVRSRKTGVFIAGADIEQLQTLTSRDEALAKSQAGQRVFNALEKVRVPTVAVIEGACLGGGLEMALACRYRIATDHPKVSLGLPEVNLGIIPGWGGTQRLPRAIGLSQALPMILGGKTVDGAKALKIGLVHHYVAQAYLEDTLHHLAQMRLKGIDQRRKRSLISKIPDSALVKRFVFEKARESVMKKSKGHYPAPLAALAVIDTTYGGSLSAGLDREANTFADLAISPTCKQLVSLFFQNEALKKLSVCERDTPVLEHAAVLGAGVMGGGIAWWLADKGTRVRMKDIAWPAVAKGLETAQGIYKTLKKIRRRTPSEINVAMHRIGGTVDYSGFRNCQLAIEAVVENLDIKRAVLRECEEQLPDTAILVTNTSSLRVDAMASALARPERFAGLHFFNPVNRMPLVEIIAGEKTDQAVIQDLIAWVRGHGKTPIVVKDCAGFLVNRLLIPYMVEAVYCLQDGADIEQVDELMERFGMPMGPFKLADEVGLDVGNKVAHELFLAYGSRMAVPDLLVEVAERKKLLGKKAKLGFYDHGQKTTEINPAIGPVVNAWRSRMSMRSGAMSDDVIQQRLMYVMFNEACRCLDEGIVETEDLLDMAMIMGTGFPPFRGGLCAWARSQGLDSIRQSCEQLAKTCGERFVPCDYLRSLR